MEDELNSNFSNPNTLKSTPKQQSRKSILDVQTLEKQLRKYQIREKQWNQQRQELLKNNQNLQKQLNKLKTLNTNLMKKVKHKRTSSEQHTFIFNQTNISSIYPMVMLQSSNWACKAHIRAHLDSVRSLFWHQDILISGSDDGTIKVWQKDQPKVTIREHLAPIYSICGSNSSTASGNYENDISLIFTAGAEGIVRMWKTSLLLSNKSGSLIDQGQFSSDCIWDMAYNQSKNILLTSSADGTCRLIHINSENNQRKNNETTFSRKKQKNKYDVCEIGQEDGNFRDSNIKQGITNNTSISMKEGKSFSVKNAIPTSIDWIGSNKFICGYTNNAKLAVYDVELGTQTKQYIFTVKETSAQTNKILFSEKHKLIISGHQDRCLRFFDPNSNKMIKNITGHSDAVTDILARAQTYEVFSCGHDGSMRVWDLRKYRCIHDIPMHMKKYDQGALCMAQKRQEFMVAVGGADGHIKLLSPQH